MQATSRHRQKGVGLIEVLVALVVLSVGLLGMATLQATSLRANHQAYLRSQAVILARDVVDRMRANRPPALAGDYDIALDAAATGTTVSATDLKQWKAALGAQLPLGDGSVAVANGVATVIIEWDNSRGQEDPEKLSVVTEI